MTWKYFHRPFILFHNKKDTILFLSLSFFFLFLFTFSLLCVLSLFHSFNSIPFYRLSIQNHIYLFYQPKKDYLFKDIHTLFFFPSLIFYNNPNFLAILFPQPRNLDTTNGENNSYPDFVSLKYFVGLSGF